MARKRLWQQYQLSSCPGYFSQRAISHFSVWQKLYTGWSYNLSCKWRQFWEWGSFQSSEDRNNQDCFEHTQGFIFYIKYNIRFTHYFCAFWASQYQLENNYIKNSEFFYNEIFWTPLFWLRGLTEKYFLFFEIVLLGILGCPELSMYPSFKITTVLLNKPLKCWNYRYILLCLTWLLFKG